MTNESTKIVCPECGSEKLLVRVCGWQLATVETDDTFGPDATFDAAAPVVDVEPYSEFDGDTEYRCSACRCRFEWDADYKENEAVVIFGGTQVVNEGGEN